MSDLGILCAPTLHNCFNPNVFLKSYFCWTLRRMASVHCNLQRKALPEIIGNSSNLKLWLPFFLKENVQQTLLPQVFFLKQTRDQKLDCGLRKEF